MQNASRQQFGVVSYYCSHLLKQFVITHFHVMHFSVNTPTHKGLRMLLL